MTDDVRLLCPAHGCEVRPTRDIFPGSPSHADMWCMAWPGGHPVRRWLRWEDGRTDTIVQPIRRALPKARVIVKMRRVVRNPRSHPWAALQGRVA